MVRRPDDSEIDIDALIARLKEGRTKGSVLLVFKNGREERGAITYQERLRRGRLIDVEREFAMDFDLAELANIDD